MVKLEIVENDNYTYKLKDNQENNYQFVFEFYDIEEKPVKGDFINMSAELLNKKYAGYSTNYAFGSMDNKCGKKDIETDDIDVIMIEKNGLEIYLKRLYG